MISSGEIEKVFINGKVFPINKNITSCNLVETTGGSGKGRSVFIKIITLIDFENSPEKYNYCIEA